MIVAQPFDNCNVVKVRRKNSAIYSHILFLLPNTAYDRSSLKLYHVGRKTIQALDEAYHYSNSQPQTHKVIGYEGFQPLGHWPLTMLLDFV